MTTPTEILNQLQAAWTTAAITSVEGLQKRPTKFGGVLLAGNTARCREHLPPFDAIEKPDKRRLGFIRSKCRHCGKFLGYRRNN